MIRLWATLLGIGADPMFALQVDNWNEALEAVIGHPDLVSELRFWVDTLELLDRLAVDDIQLARNLVDQLTESAP